MLARFDAGVPAEQPFERQPAGERQGHVLAEAQEREDILTGQPPLRTDMSAYDDAVAIETASTTPAYQPAYEPAYQPAPAYDTGTGGPRNLSPGASAIESRDLAPVR